jgi:hypothetical protein
MFRVKKAVDPLGLDYLGATNLVVRSVGET